MAEDGLPQKNAELVTSNSSDGSAVTKSLSPSDIYFIPGTIDDTNHNTETASQDARDNILQVVEKGGIYFALDHRRLGELKRQYRQGKCPYVTVTQVPLQRLPESTQELLVLPVPRKQTGRLNGRGPLKLLSFLHLDRRSSLTGARSTDEETTDDDTDRSDSECDWTAAEIK